MKRFFQRWNLNRAREIEQTIKGQKKMSFLSVIKSINSVFTKVNSVVTTLEPAIELVPAYGPAFNTVFNAIIEVENMFTALIPSSTPTTVTSNSQISAAKKAVVTTIVNSTSPAAIPEATLSTQIDQIVAALNQLQASQVALK
jgi:hypothetical protein